MAVLAFGALPSIPSCNPAKSYLQDGTALLFLRPLEHCGARLRIDEFGEKAPHHALLAVWQPPELRRIFEKGQRRA